MSGGWWCRWFPSRLAYPTRRTECSEADNQRRFDRSSHLISICKGCSRIREGVAAMRTQRGEMLRLLNRGKNDLATDDGHDHARLGQVSSRRGEYVLRQAGE